MALTGIRGVAACVVALYHFRTEVPEFSSLGALARHGEYFVDLFFVMSGYVLALSYERSFTGGFRGRDYLRFVGYRLSRIYPAHFAALTAFIIIPVAYVSTGRPLPQDRFDVTYWLAGAALVQNWGFLPKLEWNIPAWSISSELLFYIGFPLFCLTTTRLSTALRVVLYMVAILICLGFAGQRAGQLGANIPSFGPARCLLECCLGMALLKLDRFYRPGLATCNVLTLGLMALGALFSLELVADYIAIPVGVLVLLQILLCRKSVVARIASFPPVVWLGRISYSTYIIHYFIKDAVKITLVGVASDAVVLTVYISGVVLAATALYHSAETLGQRYGKRLVDFLLTTKRSDVKFPLGGSEKNT